ncbi:MAG: hypothetical protein KC983_07385, partial [Phycisphaerales bacterium]|nr:hypothetical protein [Phycisphaerales bacterium]
TLSPCQPIKLARRSNTVARDEADGEHDDAGNTDGAHASNGSPHSAGAPHGQNGANTSGGNASSGAPVTTIITTTTNAGAGNGDGSDGAQLGGGGGGAGWQISGSNVYFNAGRVGIGTSSPSYALDVRANGNRAIYAFNNANSGNNYGMYGRTISENGRAIYGQASSSEGLSVGVQGVANSPVARGVLGISQASDGDGIGVYGETNSSDGFAGYFTGGKSFVEGPLGVGLTTPLAAVDVEGDLSVRGANLLLGFYNVATTERKIHAMADIQMWTNYLNNGAEYSWWDAIYDGSGPKEMLRVEAGPTGDVLANGAFVSNGLDYAEGFKIGEEGLEPGDVVMIVDGDWERILRADEPYANLLVGVISERPSFIAGMSFDAELAADADLGRQYREAVTNEDGATIRSISNTLRERVTQQIKPVALAGRVPVKVDASFGAIRPGDRLTSSSTPGHAMVQRRSGPSIGIALEGIDSGTGQITVLIQPCWAAVNVPGGAIRPAADELNAAADMAERVSELEATVERLTQIIEEMH